ncbi:MAG: AAA family ATPase [Nostocoides sp.]
MGRDTWLEPLPVRRVRRSMDAALDDGTWPATIPAIRQVLHEGLDLGRATVIVGENGSGKSTLVEGIALAFGLSPEGGSTGAQHTTRTSESMLHDNLTLERGPGGSRWGYFLRAETMHGLYTYLEMNPSTSPRSRDPGFHDLSHGESFLAMLQTSRFAGDGFFVMDEPEAGLSFTAQLVLVGTLAQLAQQRGTQVLVATHSPILAALPGAQILELDERGIREATWDDLAVVDHHRRFLDTPERYLRHLREGD